MNVQHSNPKSHIKPDIGWHQDVGHAAGELKAANDYFLRDRQ